MPQFVELAVSAGYMNSIETSLILIIAYFVTGIALTGYDFSAPAVHQKIYVIKEDYKMAILIWFIWPYTAIREAYQESKMGRNSFKFIFGVVVLYISIFFMGKIAFLILAKLIDIAWVNYLVTLFILIFTCPTITAIAMPEHDQFYATKTTNEYKIKKLLQELNLKNKNIPTNIWDLQDDFGHQVFDEFLEEVSSGDLLILRHSRVMDSSLFSILASPTEKFIGNIGQLLFWLSIPITLLLAIFISWWCLALFPIFYWLGSKLILNSYNTSIFNAATASEAGFCLLYGIGQISVGNPENGMVVFYEKTKPNKGK